MNKTVFLDRDGTIILDQGYTHKIKDLEFLPDSIEGLRKLYDHGYNLIIVTNQAGIAKGKYKEEDYFTFKEEMQKRLKEKGVILTAEYFCPHHLMGVIERYKIDCNCRKPKIGMLEQASKDFGLNLQKCWMIGDKDLDILAGKNAGCKTIHVLTGESDVVAYADFTANNLFEAANYILTNNNK